MADDLVYRNEVLGALLEAGQKSRRYKLGDVWELNFDEIRDAIATVQSAQPTDCIPLHVVIDAITKIIRGAHPIEVAHQILPSAQRTGRWVRNDNGTYSCSICQSWVPAEQRLYARYCLYCGSPMEVEE